MTLYRKTRLFFLWVLFVFFTFPFWMLFLWWQFGEKGVIAGGAFWLAHGALMLAFRCPECGLSPFVSNKGFFAMSTPWPRRYCGHCGHDHNEGDPFDRY